jgi:hypothetical protein
MDMLCSSNDMDECRQSTGLIPALASVSGWTMLFGKVAIVEDVMTDGRIPFQAYLPTSVRSLVMVAVRQAAPVAALENRALSRREAVNLRSTLAGTPRQRGHPRETDPAGLGL